jgi:hypothetical protein
MRLITRLSLILFSATVLFAQHFPLPPKAGAGQDEVKTHGRQIVPKDGTLHVPLFDMLHPSGYLLRPGCWVKEIEKKQHVMHLENDLVQLTITAHPGALVEWECHGFMKKTTPTPVLTPAKPG